MDRVKHKVPWNPVMRNAKKRPKPKFNPHYYESQSISMEDASITDENEFTSPETQLIDKNAEQQEILAAAEVEEEQERLCKYYYI